MTSSWWCHRLAKNPQWPRLNAFTFIPPKTKKLDTGDFPVNISHDILTKLNQKPRKRRNGCFSIAIENFIFVDGKDFSKDTPDKIQVTSSPVSKKNQKWPTPSNSVVWTKLDDIDPGMLHSLASVFGLKYFLGKTPEMLLISLKC